MDRIDELETKKTPVIEPIIKAITKAITPDTDKKFIKIKKEKKEKKEKNTEEHRMTDKRKEALAKARIAQKAKRDAKKKEDEEHKITIKSLHGLVDSLHGRLDKLENYRLHEQKNMPKKMHIEALSNKPAPVGLDPHQPQVPPPQPTIYHAITPQAPQRARPIPTYSPYTDPRPPVETGPTGYQRLMGLTHRF